ncbi:MAG: hypothetical protein HQL77_07020 [Magnetococcales bacterium]|nr:hypothetical protein [Magnetococcales bacterium]
MSAMFLGSFLVSTHFGNFTFVLVPDYLCFGIGIAYLGGTLWFNEENFFRRGVFLLLIFELLIPIVLRLLSLDFNWFFTFGIYTGVMLPNLIGSFVFLGLLYLLFVFGRTKPILRDGMCQ